MCVFIIIDFILFIKACIFDNNSINVRSMVKKTFSPITKAQSNMYVRQCMWLDPMVPYVHTVCIYMYVCMYVRTYVRVYVCMCV